MKRAVIIIILTITLVTIGIWEMIIVNNIISNLDQNIDKLIPIYETNKNDVSIAFDTVKEMKSKWEKDEYNLSLIYNHNDLMMINDSLCKLTTYTKNNDYDNAIAEVYLLKEYSEKNTSIMGFNFQNIF